MEKEKITRKTIRIDATDKTVGRLSTEIALILRGKNKPEFEPNKDIGDTVQVSNIGKLKFTGKKLEQKKYYHFSGYPGGLKEKKISELLKSAPEKILKNAVRKMLPDNKLRNKMLKRLVIIKNS